MMFNKFERMMAFRYLRAKRRESFISVVSIFSILGIMLGVAALIVVMAVMNGFRHELTGKLLQTDGHVMIQAPKLGIENYQKIINQITTIKGVERVYPVIEGEVMATSKGQAMGAMVKGIDLANLIENQLISENITAGDISSLEGESIIIGEELAFQLGARLGDVVTLISPQGNNTVLGKLPRTQDYIVAGIFKSGVYHYDLTTIFMNLDQAKIYFKWYDKVNKIEIYVSDPQQSWQFITYIKEMIGMYRVVDWMSQNEHIFNALEIERVVMFLILALIILVAAFNIISGLVMLVREKGQNIAILRTMGATPASIMRIFLLCGSGIGIIGTILGVLLGTGFAYNIEEIRQFLQNLTGVTIFDPVVYFLSKLPAKIFPADIIQIGLLSLALSLVATIYPAYRASKMNPAESLRYE